MKWDRSMRQIAVLVVVVLVLALGYYGLERYSEGQKDMLAVETRGLNMVGALTRYKLNAGSYPDALDKLVPKFAPAVPKCPDGQAIAYEMSGGADYTLSCQNVVFKAKPYIYDSRTRVWSD